MPKHIQAFIYIFGIVAIAALISIHTRISNLTEIISIHTDILEVHNEILSNIIRR